MDVHNYFLSCILFCIIFGILLFYSYQSYSYKLNTKLSMNISFWVFSFQQAINVHPFCFGEERGRERKYKLIIIKIGRSICCLMLIDLAFNTSLKHFVLTKSMCWLAFERKTKNIMLCALPLCFQLVIFEQLMYNTTKLINTGTIFVLSSFMQQL